MQITVAIKDDRPEFFEGKGTPMSGVDVEEAGPGSLGLDASLKLLTKCGEICE